MITRKQFRKGYKRQSNLVTLEEDIYLSGDIEDAIKTLRNLKKKHKGFEPIRLSFDYDYGWGNDERSTELNLTGYKLETLEELDIRIQKDIDWKKEQEGRKLDEYERLKKELGK